MRHRTFTIGLLTLILIGIVVIVIELDRIEKKSFIQVYPTEVVVIETNQLPIFMEDLGFRESSDNYQAVNRFGYIGKYQFGSAALKDLGIKNKERFLNDSLRQDRAFIALCSVNKYRLRHFITKYEGVVINGIRITESGLLAAAHLVGADSVKKYLRSNGKRIREDGNGVSLEHYLELFQGYNLEINANRTAKI